MRCALRRLGAPAFRAASAAAAVAALHSQGECQLQSSQRFESLPEKYTPQRFTPGVAYPGWDHNWDYLNLPPKAVAKDLGHAWPIHDYAEAIKKLFAEHYEFGPTAKYKTMADVEKLIGRRKHDLPELYRESYMLHAWGGAPRRIIILVRHRPVYQAQHSGELSARERHAHACTHMHMHAPTRTRTALGRATGELRARVTSESSLSRIGWVRVRACTHMHVYLSPYRIGVGAPRARLTTLIVARLRLRLRPLGDP